jgi:tetratricopeptide (TPR) repeat protein
MAEAFDEVIVTGSEINPTKSIIVQPWSPDRPYLSALNAASTSERWQVFLREREQYGQTPAFFLDVGDFWQQQGEAGKAVQTVLSALELLQANSGTKTAVADRLLAYGYPAIAVELYRQVLRAEPFRPQPSYDLALALVALADAGPKGDAADQAWLEALQHFDHIIREPWNSDYDGVELITLMEANALIARLPKRLANRIPLDPDLIKNLDVDIRVVIDWNFDRADMDLWVTEPNGEAAGYSHQLTGFGGQVSNDMTRGYGPEQYLVRRAQDGVYKIEAHYFGADAYNPNGHIAVRARIYRDFGRPGQSLQTVIVELKEQDKDRYKLGEITVQ